MNAHITKNNNISAGTVARTAVLGLALANQILSACGKPLRRQGVRLHRATAPGTIWFPGLFLFASDLFRHIATH